MSFVTVPGGPQYTRLVLVVCINGPINSGKSTIGRLLAERIDGAVFVEGDDHDRHGAALDEVIRAGVARLAGIIREQRGVSVLVMAFPLRSEDYSQLCVAAAEVGAEICCVTLSPTEEVALGRRGGRELDARERARVREMYAEGYARREFSDLVVDNSETTVEESVEAIGRWLNGRYPSAAARL